MKVVRMNDKDPQSRRLRELLSKIREDHSEPEFKPRNFNSHTLYQEAANKITAEADINIVKEIALYYLNCMCAVMPDHAATMVFDQMDGV
jgi:hypothetical protein